MPHAELVMLADSGHPPWIDEPKLVGERTLAGADTAAQQARPVVEFG
jgi:hypothetical protein